MLRNTGIVPQMQNFLLSELTVEYGYVNGDYIEEVDNVYHEACFFAAGVSLARFHSHTLSGYGFVFTSRDTESEWWSLQDKRFEEMLFYCQTQHFLEEAVVRQLAKIYTYYRATTEPEQESCLCHCDYRLDNLLFFRESKTWICKVLDFDHVIASPPHFDFGRIQQDIFNAFPGSINPFLRGYESVKALPDLQNLLPLYRIIWPLTHVVWGSMNNTADLVLQNQHRLKKLCREEQGFL